MGENFHVHIFGTSLILFVLKGNEGLKLGSQIKKTTIQLRGVDECEWANILVNISTFLQFLLHVSMWCHFNGMLIMESCVHSLIWILRTLKWVKKSSNIEVWLEQMMFNNFIRCYYFHKGPFSFHNRIFFNVVFLKKRLLLDTYKKHSLFHISSIFCLKKIGVCLKFMSLLQHVNVMRCIYCSKTSCSL